MNPSKIGKRVVVITGTASTSQNTDNRKTIEQHTTRRIDLSPSGRKLTLAGPQNKEPSAYQNERLKPADPSCANS